MIRNLGKYMFMLYHIFFKPENFSVYWKRFLDEVIQLGVKSLFIVSIMSAFMGAVLVIQTATAIESAWIPDYTVGFTIKQSMLLEFCPTIISLILAGKVGSNIASELGTMRVTEQIDALEVMGINTYNYLIFPKIVALSLYPLIICISMFLGILGGYIACVYGGFSSGADFVEGIQMDFIPFHVGYSFIKTLFFSFILATIPSYHGYFMTGGALEVGKASTVSFVWTSVVIILVNYLITQLLLT